MPEKNRFFTGFVPFGIVSLAILAFSGNINEQNFSWLASGLSLSSVLLALYFGRQNSGSALLGIAIGVYVAIAMYGSLHMDQQGVAVESHFYLLLAYLAIALGFPLGVLVRVAAGETTPRLLTAIVFGLVACLYIPIALGAYWYLGLPEILLDPFNPWFHFGSVLNLGGLSIMLNVLGVCVAGGIALLVLSWPLFLTLGFVAAAISR